jgi:hypothetical protein
MACTVQDRELEAAARAFEKAVQQCVAQWRKAIDIDAGRGGARDSLRFLARKANCAEEDFLLEFLAILRPYSIPPARSRLPEIGRIERFAARLRDAAEQVREDPACGLYAGILPSRYSPRRTETSLPIPETPVAVLHPELERLPEMLEQYASTLEKKAHLLRRSAKQEPTKNQYSKDCADEVVTWLKQVTGEAYREKVVSILRVLRPSIAVEAETLRKRAYRQRKSRPA